MKFLYYTTTAITIMNGGQKDRKSDRNVDKDKEKTKKYRQTDKLTKKDRTKSQRNKKTEIKKT